MKKSTYDPSTRSCRRRLCGCFVNHLFRNRLNIQNFQTGRRLGSHQLRAGPARGSKESSSVNRWFRLYLTHTRKRTEGSPKRPLEVIYNKNLVSGESYDLSNGVGFPGNRSPEPVRPIHSVLVRPTRRRRLLYSWKPVLDSRSPGRSCRRLSRCTIPLLFQAHCLRPGSKRGYESL